MTRSAEAQNRVVRAYDWGVMSPSVAVIDAIARFEGETTSRMAEQLTPSLADVLDTDALNALLTRNAGLSLEFDFGDYHVQIDGDAIAITDHPTTRPHPNRP